MLVERVSRLLFIEANQNTVTIFHRIHSHNSHFKNVLNKGATELAEIGICHVIRYSKNTCQWFPFDLIHTQKEIENQKWKLNLRRRRRRRLNWLGWYRKRRRRFVGEEVHEAASFFDSRVSRREIENGSGEWKRFTRFLLGDSAWTPHR